MPKPVLSGSKPLVGAHRLAVEHHKQRIAIAEIIAHALLASIAVARIVVGVAEKVVGALGVFSAHVVVVSVHASPHIFAEDGFIVHRLPKRVTAAPRNHIAEVQHPVERRVFAANGVDHRHCRAQA